MCNRINCLVGKNGSGKTTILKILAGFENAGILRGSVEMNDMNYFQNRYELFGSQVFYCSPSQTLFDKNLSVY